MIVSAFSDAPVPTGTKTAPTDSIASFEVNPATKSVSPDA
jgi:hypothetical protein